MHDIPIGIFLICILEIEYSTVQKFEIGKNFFYVFESSILSCI